MPRVDAIDISHHNTLTTAGFDALPDSVRMCCHKINEGRALDREFARRMPAIAASFEMFGGYTVLLPEGPGRSTIRQQIEIYAGSIERWWRPGALTQLDVELWNGRYERPVSVAEILEAADHHERLLGRRPLVYINPREMPAQFAPWHARPDRDPFWEPYYDPTAPWKFGHPSDRDAAIWQWSSTWSTPAFTSGIDANEILDWSAVETCAGVDVASDPPPPPPVPPITEPQEDWPMIPDTGEAFDSTSGPVLNSHTEYEVDLGWAKTCIVRFEVINPTKSGYLILNGNENSKSVNYIAGFPVTAGTWFGACPNGKLTFKLLGPELHNAHVIATIQGRG